MTEKVQLCRSYQTTPAATSGEDSAKYLYSASKQEGLELPDWFSPDLEDSTPPSMKEEGRENLINFARKNSDFMGEIRPRVNWAYYEVDEGTNISDVKKLGEQDIKEIVQEAGENIDGFVVPKIGRVENAKQAEKVIAEAEREFGYEENTFEMTPIIETTRAISDLQEIGIFASSTPRLTAFIWGPGDYTFDIGGKMSRGRFPDWLSIKETISNEASANGLLCVGGPYPEIYRNQGGEEYYNAAGYASYVEQEAEIGYDGSWALHPKQTVQANRLHVPSEDDLNGIIRRLKLYNEQEGAGSLLVDGEMIDAGMLKHWNRKIEKILIIDKKYDGQAEELYDTELVEEAKSIVNIRE